MASDDEAPGDEVREVPEERTRRRGASPVVVVVLVGVALVGGAVLAYRWWTDPYRTPAPPPTVTGDECGFSNPPGAVLAVDARTGDLRWSRLVTPMDGDWADTQAGLALADGSLVVFTGDGRIQALDAADGAHRWCADGGLVTGVSDRLFTIRDGDTVELDPTSGRASTVDLTVLTDLLEAAADPIAIGSESMPQREDGVHQGRALTATDRASGAVLWERDVPGYEVVTTADLVIVNDQTNGAFRFAGDINESATLAAYDIDDGQQAWSRELPHFGTLFLAGPNRAVVQHWRTGTVRLVDTTDGTTVWVAPHDNPGRSRLYSERGGLTAVAADPITDTIYLLLVSSQPRRD